MTLKVYLSLHLKRIHSPIHMDEPYSFIHSTLEIEKSIFENFIVVFSDYILLQKIFMVFSDKIPVFSKILFLNCFGSATPRKKLVLVCKIFHHNTMANVSISATSAICFGSETLPKKLVLVCKIENFSSQYHG